MPTGQLSPSADELIARARALWEQGRAREARASLAVAGRSEAAGEARLAFARWAMSEAFSAPMLGRRVKLVRRSPEHLGFVRSAWADRAFMERFHRFARALPATDPALERLLSGEARATLLDSRHLHWTIVGLGDARPLGMASVAEVSLEHRRAEFIVGVRDAAPGVALESTLLALDWAFRTMRLQKATAAVYGGNDYAFASARHLGFQVEGRLRRHLKDPATGEYVDLSLLGLLAEEFYSPANRRLARRLLGRDLLR